MLTSAQKRIAILGSTGSIGTQALAIVDQFPERLSVAVLTSHRNTELLIAQARRYRPSAVVIADESGYETVKTALADLPITVMAGAKAMEEVVQRDDIDIVLTALVGFAGLQPTLSAISAGKTIALANKETLVVAGALVQEALQANSVDLIPVDSEHSAIFQCLIGEPHSGIRQLILTASGGPFRGYSADQLQQVTLEQALKHPNWSMGSKITIDSASMMNKGLEIIEAKWLFDIDPKAISVIVHPQSIIHSLVEFEDGSLKAQLGLPDMRLPIQYAFSYPNRWANNFPKFNFKNYAQLTFEPVDRAVFRSIDLAYDAIERGGNRPCVLNAANEVAVQAILEQKLPFHRIYDCLEAIIEQVPYEPTPTLATLIEADLQARQLTNAWI
jgi:1-deoxy-D-xylulose-5-phosphate reductoisomerase